MAARYRMCQMRSMHEPGSVSSVARDYWSLSRLAASCGNGARFESLPADPILTAPGTSVNEMRQFHHMGGVVNCEHKMHHAGNAVSIVLSWRRSTVQTCLTAALALKITHFSKLQALAGHR